MIRVHVLNPSKTEESTVLRQRLEAGIALTFGPDLPAPAEFEIIVAGRPKREHLTASPNLRALIIPWAGVSPETRALLLEFPRLAVYNSHHNAEATAEMAMALLLAAAKFLVPLDRALRAHDWRLRYTGYPTTLLAGKTVLILGYGAIGRRVAQMCRGFSMNVIATRRSTTRTESDSLAEIYPMQALPELLPRADVLVVCLPLTDETRGLIGAKALALLPRGALLVNVGRGPVVDEAALFEALKSGVLLGAGLDVWYNYPGGEAEYANTPPSQFPFHELDNVVLSPHRAGELGGEEIERLGMEELARTINALARGEEPESRVDVQRGY